MFFIAIGGILFVLVAGELLNVAKGRVMATVSSTIAADLGKLVYDKIQNLSLGFLTSQRAGDLMNRVTSIQTELDGLYKKCLQLPFIK